MTKAAEGMRETRRMVVAAVVLFSAALALMLALPSVASAAPANDDFAAAQVISGSDVSVGGTNVGATTETGEPDTTGVAHSSVWYRWTAPESGQVVVDTCTSDFDTVLSVYAADQTQVALDDNSCTSTEGNDFGSKLTFDATSGQTYYIRVASKDGDPAQGTFTLRLRYPPPANDNFAGFQQISGESVSTSGTNVRATLETGEGGSNFPGTRSVWYRWTAPHSGQVAIDTCTSNFNTILSVYTGRAMTGLTRTVQDDNLCTSAEGNDLGSKVTFATAGATYYIRVATSPGSPSQQGNFTLDVDYVAPDNDNFTSARIASANDGSVAGTNVEATLETGEPDTTGVAHSSVWYSLTTLETGQVVVDTCTSDFDTVLSVYTGTSVGSLTQTAIDDQGCTGAGPNNDGSKLTFDATSGQTYRIRVASWAGDPEQGSFTLRTRYVPPLNDNFADAETISGDSTSASGDNVGASTEAGETVTGFQSSRSVWYRWTAPDTGLATLHTCLSDFDTVLSVHTGSALSSLAQVTANDQGCGFGNSGSQVFFDATEDTVYYIRVASFGSSVNTQGNFILNLVLADNVAPDTTITDGPSGLTNDDTPTFTFSGTDNRTATENLRYAHAVDGVWTSEFLSDTSVTLGSLPDGPHTFHVQALDEANNSDGTPAERSFTVETEAPRVETVSPEGGGAPRLDDLTATFSEPMKPASISPTNIKMKVGKKAVPVGVSLSDDGKRATINPFPTDDLRALAPNKTYKVTITTGAQDLSGKALDQNPALSGNQPKTWTFTTGAT